MFQLALVRPDRVRPYGGPVTVLSFENLGAGPWHVGSPMVGIFWIVWKRCLSFSSRRVMVRILISVLLPIWSIFAMGSALPSLHPISLHGGFPGTVSSVKRNASSPQPTRCADHCATIQSNSPLSHDLFLRRHERNQVSHRVRRAHKAAPIPALLLRPKFSPAPKASDRATVALSKVQRGRSPPVF